MGERENSMVAKEVLSITPISALSESIGKEVLIAGWVHTLRDQKRMKFVLLRDDSGIAQVTVDGEKQKDLAEVVSGLSLESAVRVRGKVVENPIVKVGGLEVLPDEIITENIAEPNLPINVKGQPSSLDSRLDWRFLDLRRPENRIIFELQTAAEHAMREFWRKEGFIEIHSPKLMGTPSESGAELFELKDYFGKKAFLAQSPQFYKQYAIGAGFQRVFEVGPVFRANPSFTARHDTEFTSVDVEIAWINSHQDVMALEERWLQYVLKSLAEEYNPQIRKSFDTEIVVPQIPFPKFTMEEAQRILREEMGHTPPSDTKKGDLDPQGEKLLGEYVEKKFGHQFVFVTDWSSNIRPFYHMRYEDNPGLTKSFDLLWGGLEVTTGAQREHRYDVLLKQAKEKGIKLEPISFYLDLFKFGIPSHGGYGFGLTRMLMQILGLKNVREVTFLYRGPKRLSP